MIYQRNPRNRVSTFCDCSDTNHQMQFLFDDWGDDDPSLYVSVQLNQRYGFFARVWLAIKYICGVRSRFGYGHWDEGSISPESAKEVRRLLDDFIFYSDTMKSLIQLPYTYKELEDAYQKYLEIKKKRDIEMTNSCSRPQLCIKGDENECS